VPCNTFCGSWSGAKVPLASGTHLPAMKPRNLRDLGLQVLRDNTTDAAGAPRRTPHAIFSQGRKARSEPIHLPGYGHLDPGGLSLRVQEQVKRESHAARVGHLPTGSKGSSDTGAGAM
jgi:hypothetical protein